MNKIEIGTKVKWESAAGIGVGEVAKMWIGLNAASEMVPWIMIAYPVYGRKAPATTVLCATESNLKMMKVKVM